MKRIGNFLFWSIVIIGSGATLYKVLVSPAASIARWSFG